MGGILTIILGAVGPLSAGLAALPHGSSQADYAIVRELALYRRCYLAKERTCANAAQIAIVGLSPQILPRAAAMIPVLWEARTRFEISLAIALIRREMEPQ